MPYSLELVHKVFPIQTKILYINSTIKACFAHLPTYNNAVINPPAIAQTHWIALQTQGRDSCMYVKAIAICTYMRRERVQLYNTCHALQTDDVTMDYMYGWSIIGMQYPIKIGQLHKLGGYLIKACFAHYHTSYTPSLFCSIQLFKMTSINIYRC